MTDHQWYILGFIHRMHAQICGKMRNFDCHANNDAYKIHHESSFSALSLSFSIELDQVFTKWKRILSFSPHPQPPPPSPSSSFASSSIFACFYLFEKVVWSDDEGAICIFYERWIFFIVSLPASTSSLGIFSYIDLSHSFCVCICWVWDKKLLGFHRRLHQISLGLILNRHR